MKNFKENVVKTIAILGIALVGYHWTEGFAAFSSPCVFNIPYLAAMIIWSLMFMIVLKDWVRANIRDKWLEKAVKRVKVTCVTIIAFCVGCTIANIDILGMVLTKKEIIPLLMLPFASTVLYGLKPEKEKSGWIGGDIEH